MRSTFDDADAVERRAARLKGLLAATDEPVRGVNYPAERIARATRRGVLVRRLGIAAAVALLLAGTVPPVRAWIAGSAKTLWSLISRPASPAAAPAPTAAPADSGFVGAVTMTAGETFNLRVFARQASGQLSVEMTDQPQASAAIAGQAGDAELIVLPDGLRIVNRAGATSSYVVRVPAGVTRLTVQMPGAPLRTLRPGPGQRWTIDLGASR